jgi:adenylate kinase family enzyme
MRIHICGIYGSGKSTLAEALSKEFKIKNYELDDLKYKIKYSKERSVKERIALLKKICSKKNWIVEGPWTTYAIDAFKKADLIVIMNTSPWVCSYRILKRHFSRNKKEKTDLKTNLKLMWKTFRYRYTKDTISLKAHRQLIEKYKKNYIIVKRKNQIPEVVDVIKTLLLDMKKTRL